MLFLVRPDVGNLRVVLTILINVLFSHNTSYMYYCIGVQMYQSDSYMYVHVPLLLFSVCCDFSSFIEAMSDYFIIYYRDLILLLQADRETIWLPY